MKIHQTPGLKQFIQPLVENPGDATLLGAVCDYIDETVGADDRDVCFESDLKYLRGCVTALPKAHREWLAFSKRVNELAEAMRTWLDVAPADQLRTARPIGVRSLQRDSQPVRTANIRALLKDLKIPHVSVSNATGSMCFWTNVKVPADQQRQYLFPLTQDASASGAGDDANQLTQANLELIVLAAYPNYEDRSDSLTDYYNFVFRIEEKRLGAYFPKVKTAKRETA